MAEDQEDYSLSRQNLIPFYLIEDRIKGNFTKIQSFIGNQTNKNKQVSEELNKLNNYNSKFKEEVTNKFIQLEKKIISQINAELEGRIIVAINKNMASFTNRMVEKEKQFEKVSSGINQKLDAVKKAIVYQVSKENQKFFAKQSEKLEKKIKGNVEQTIKKSSPSKQSSVRPSSRQKTQQKQSKSTHHEVQSVHPHSPQTYFTEEWVLKIKQIDDKVKRFQQFSVNFQKRFYENSTSLKESWKQLGQDILDTKRKLVAKQDELKLELIKIKTMKQFDGSPDDYEETFKMKLMSKFTDIYQLISQSVTKADLQNTFDKNKKTLNRHDNQLSDLRDQMAKNSDYFTFYANNSNEQDLSLKIKQLNQLISQRQSMSQQKHKLQTEKNEILQKEIAVLNQNLQKSNIKSTKLQKGLSQFRQQFFKQIQRIDVLQEQNNFTPQKMNKIHNSLDVGFSPPQQELIAKKEHSQVQNTAIRQVKTEISKLKDQLFVLTHEVSQFDKIKKNISGLESKIDKFKIQSDEAILSRKPWVCLSCDKEKQEDKMKKENSKKKLSENRAVLFTKQKSDKLLKLIPTAQQKFEVYERYREKYLTDTVRLPDIYREKIGDKQP